MWFSFSSSWGDAEESTESAHNVRPAELHDVDSNPSAAAEARPAIHPHNERLQDANVMGCLNDDTKSICISEDTVEFHDESEWGSVGDNEAAAISNEKCSNAVLVPPSSVAAAAASQHPPPPPSACFHNTSDDEVMPPPQSDLVRRLLLSDLNVISYTLYYP